MKNSTGFRKGEEGQALVFVTLTLVLTMLVIPPLLNFIGGAGRTAQIREDRMLKVYAADAGIEEAYYKIIAGNITPEFTIEDVEGYVVDVKISEESSGVYKVTSAATGFEGGNAIIESIVGAVNFKDFLDHVISSEGDIQIKPGSEVFGNVTLNGKLKLLGDLDCEGGSGEECATQPVPQWPEPGELGDYYWDLLAEQGNGTRYTCDPDSGTVDVDGDETMFWGPCYTDDSIEFKVGTGKGGNVTLNTPEGLLYVNGDFNFGKNLNLYLNGNTIYAKGDIIVGVKTGGLDPDAASIYGPGCLIAEGDVKFFPKQGGDGEFIFVMSVNGQIDVQPNGHFTGSFAGKTEVDLLPGYTLTWVEYPVDENGDPDLDFPGGAGTSAKIMYYIIKQ
jgi:hypothetical protein